MSRAVLFHDDSRRKLLKGLDLCAEAVGGTLGPKGKNAFIEQQYQNLITNDGATIAANIELEDKFENMGAGIIKNASNQTNDDCGDGTTTTAVLTQAIVHEALNRPENPMEIRESLNEACKEAVELLKKQSVPVKPEDLGAVALISAENKEIADMIIEIIGKLGDKAVINIEDSRTFENSVEVVPGYDAPVGFVSPYFINDQKTGKANFENVHVLVSEKKMNNLVDLQPIAEIFKQEKIGQCVFVCQDIDESLIGVLVRNNLQGIFKSVVIRAKGEILDDIAGAVGATSVSDANGVNFQNIKLSDLGKVESVSVSANKSVFLGNKVSGTLRAAELEGQAETEENWYRKAKLKDRAAKLRGGVGVIKIGAHTDFERDYLKLKAEDAVKAVQAAMEEGVVEGGGMAWWRISAQMNSSLGGQILNKALKSPLIKIIENAGQEYADVVYNLSFKGSNQGYDAKRNQMWNLFEQGIIDPTKVERCALENAVSAAGAFLTSFVSITNIPEKK